MFFGLLMLFAGGLAGEFISHTAKGQLLWFYGKHPVQAYITIGATLLTISFLWLNVREVKAEREKAIDEREFADVSFGITGISYKTTPAIRTAVFIAMYLMGVALFVFLA